MVKRAVGGGPVEKLSRVRQRQKLIDACISALYVHGPTRTTIDKVVAIADMSPGIVNFYFETKAALLVAALDYLAVEFEDRVLAPLAALRDTPVPALQRLIGLYLDPDIASPRKVSVWYAFWGEASSRREYFEICGKRDQAFADLVRDLVARLIEQGGAAHLDADAIALGLIGALEIIWQQIAFQEEADIDRAAARLRCQAYLRSVFPAEFAAAGEAAAATGPVAAAGPAASAGSEAAMALLVAAELTLAGVPSLAVPPGWPGYAVLAQPPGRAPQRVAVVAGPLPDAAPLLFEAAPGSFDWLAIVLPPRAGAPRRVFVLPRAVADALLRRNEAAAAKDVIAQPDVVLAAFEANFGLREEGDGSTA